MDKKLLTNMKKVWDLKPEEAINFLKDQGYEVSWDWKEQLDIIKQHAFTVAKVTGADVLQLIHEELIRAAEDGTLFNDFQDQMQQKFNESGFVPSKQNGAWRLDIIYRTNMQTAYMAGRYNEMKSAEANFPFWQYIAVLDDRTRPAHASLDGKVIRADDSFWSTSYPPNGYRCFPAGTLISTADGWRNIEDIKINDLVIGGSGELRKVTQTYLNSFNGQFVRIITKKGGTVLTTPNHRILTLRGWIKAANLTVDDIIIDSTKMSPYFNDTVANIDKLNAKRLNDLITAPRNVVSPALAVTLNTNLESREININPKISNPVIENSFDSETVQKIDHQLFAFSRLGFRVGMRKWVNSLRNNFTNAHFLSNFISSCRSRINQLGRLQSLCFRNILSLASPIRLLSTKIIDVLDSHMFTSSLTPCLIVEPLHLNGFGAMSDINLVFSQKLHDCMIPHVPSSTQLANSEVVGDVEIEEGFTYGAPLDSFNSLDSFVSYALHNYSLNAIDKIEYTNIQNNTDIYNIEVEKDESYITKIGIVHNCRCRVIALDSDYIKLHNLKVDSGSDINYQPDDGFELNPAEAWQPDLTKFEPALAKVLKGALK